MQLTAPADERLAKGGFGRRLVGALIDLPFVAGLLVFLVIAATAWRRCLNKWLSIFPSGAGLLVATIRENGQAFHDSVSGTLVVRRMLEVDEG